MHEHKHTNIEVDVVAGITFIQPVVLQVDPDSLNKDMDTADDIHTNI